MAVSGLTEFQLWSKGGWPRVEVAGESFHQDEIRSLLPPGPSEGGVEIESTAYLIPEPSNRHDGNAVRVEVQGRLVGYLPKEVAGEYAPVLTSLVARGLAPATPCRIWAYERDEWKGYDKRGRDVYERVLNAQASIVLDAAHLILPMNVEPTRAHRTLPHGSALQVRGEEKRLEVLAPWVAQHGEGWVFGELRVIAVQGGRTAKEVVEILIDGDVIGELTPAMSAHYVPVIQHGISHGESLVAKVFLKGKRSEGGSGPTRRKSPRNPYGLDGWCDGLACGDFSYAPRSGQHAWPNPGCDIDPCGPGLRASSEADTHCLQPSAWMAPRSRWMGATSGLEASLRMALPT